MLAQKRTVPLQYQTGKSKTKRRIIKQVTEMVYTGWFISSRMRIKPRSLSQERSFLGLQIQLPKVKAWAFFGPSLIYSVWEGGCSSGFSRREVLGRSLNLPLSSQLGITERMITGVLEVQNLLLAIMDENIQDRRMDIDRISINFRHPHCQQPQMS